MKAIQITQTYTQKKHSIKRFYNFIPSPIT